MALRRESANDPTRTFVRLFARLQFRAVELVDLVVDRLDHIRHVEGAGQREGLPAAGGQSEHRSLSPLAIATFGYCQQHLRKWAWPI